MKGKAVGRDGVPVEALKCLDWHSQVLVLGVFEKRANAIPGYSDIVEDWTAMLAQFIPKAVKALDEDNCWRALLVGCALQKWYLNCLRLLSEPVLETLPSYIMGFRKGFQTAMLVEPLRIALLLAREWLLPIAVASTDVDAAFESIDHGHLVA
eukprot:10053225-Karenia_brevis.AAC.1